MRGGSVNRSLFRRFGRVLNRSLPFFGGILILASASQTAQAFYDAAVDYAHDISNGDEESGSAAIMAGTCNDLAPGSGNLVLSFFLGVAELRNQAARASDVALVQCANLTH